MKNQRFYPAFGFLTCAFAEMEADLRMLIAGVAFGENKITAATFLDSSQLGENVQTLRKLARQHWDHDAAFIDIAKRIEKLRPTRNLFIHGLWRPGTFGEPNGTACVRDLNSAYEAQPTQRTWVRGKETAYTVDDFNALLREIGAVIEHIKKLSDALEKDEDIEFGHFGATTTGKPLRMSIRADGVLQQEDQPD